MLAVCAVQAYGQTASQHRYAVQIDIRNAYISGICIQKQEGDTVTASIVNEFGVSALTYRYDVTRQKVKILGILKQMDRPAVKRVLRKDLQTIMGDMTKEDFEEKLPYEYENSKYKIRYHIAQL